MSTRFFQWDANAKPIIKRAREEAKLVVHAWQPFNRQKGQPDVVIPYAGVTWLVEIKKPGEDLSEDQKKWHAQWAKAGGGPIAVIHTYEELLVAIGYREVVK